MVGQSQEKWSEQMQMKGQSREGAKLVDVECTLFQVLNHSSRGDNSSKQGRILISGNDSTCVEKKH
jgi:hypothetical protein